MTSQLRPAALPPCSTIAIHWSSARLERATAPASGGDALAGVACLMFGIGTHGRDWLACVGASGWFAGLEPRAGDLGLGDVPRGEWAAPLNAGPSESAAASRGLFASAPLPAGWLATVAVSRAATAGERAAALGLVGALRERRDPRGRRLGVVVTLQASPDTEPDDFERALLEQGAFIVRGALSDHLHHFPLRALVDPPDGRRICVELADYLLTWRPGRVADLHVLDFAEGDGVAALPRLSTGASGPVRALNIGFNIDDTGRQLAAIEGFAERCRDRFGVPADATVYTDTTRLDGRTGSVDILVIRDGLQPTA